MSARSPRPIAVVVIFDLAAAIAWATEPDDVEERRRRGEAVKKALASVLELHREEINAEARLAASWTSRPPSTHAIGAN